MAWIAATISVAGAYLMSDDDSSGAASESSRQQAEIARDQWAQYKQYIQPLEIQNAEQAKNYSSIANKEKAATQSVADVSAQFAGLRDRLSKSPGFNPHSEAYQRTMADLGLKEAAQKATAATGARDKVQALGDAKMTDAISLGKGLSAGAQTGLASAAAQQTAAARQSNLEAQQFGQAVGGIMGGKGFRNWASDAGSASGATSSATTGDPETDRLIGLSQ